MCGGGHREAYDHPFEKERANICMAEVGAEWADYRLTEDGDAGKHQDLIVGLNCVQPCFFFLFARKVQDFRGIGRREKNSSRVSNNESWS